MTKEQLQWAMYEAYVAQLLNRIEAQEAEIARLGTMAEQTRADAVTRAAADEKRIEALRHESERWKAAYSDRCAEVTHDTPEGKDVAESVIRDSRSRDINDGDLVEVVSDTGRNTWLADVGSVGTVTSIETINDSISVHLDDVPGKKNVLAGYVSLCDVRKVTT